MSVTALPLTSKSKGRSSVSNGSRLFVDADARSAWSRRFRDVFEAHTSDLGGFETLSEGQKQLCRRAASLALECERIEGQMAEGNPDADADLLGRLSGHLRRIVETIGLERKQKTLTLRDRMKAAGS